jgi:hypothetical protein
VDQFGNAYITGTTTSTNLPVRGVTNSVAMVAEYRTTTNQVKNSGRHDAYVAQFDAAGAQLIFSVYLGGRGQDFGNGVAVDGACNAFVVGRTAKDGNRISRNFSTHDVLMNFPPELIIPAQEFFGGERTPRGIGDAFITKFVAAQSCSLMASSVPGGMMLLWPAAASEFQLESTDRFGEGWVPVAAQPFVTNAQNSIFIPASTQTRFFRLRSR